MDKFGAPNENHSHLEIKQKKTAQPRMRWAVKKLFTLLPKSIIAFCDGVMLAK